MAIVVDFGLDVHAYSAQFSQLTFPRPDTCPHCSAPGSLWGHGSYVRKVCDHQQELAIRVKRLLCSVCRHTVSLLPCFCLPFRHYQAASIQSVLSLRFGAAASWSAIRQRFAPSDLPVLSTCRAWVQAFAEASERYVSHLLRQLAQWQLGPGKLELAVGDIAAAGSKPQQLLAAVPHLAAWLRERGGSGAEGNWGRANDQRGWLSLLNRWGSRAKLGKLLSANCKSKCPRGHLIRGCATLRC